MYFQEQVLLAFMKGTKVNMKPLILLNLKRSAEAQEDFITFSQEDADRTFQAVAQEVNL